MATIAPRDAGTLGDNQLVDALCEALHAYYLEPPTPALAARRTDVAVLTAEVRLRLAERIVPPWAGAR